MRHGIDTGFLVAFEVAGHADHLAARSILNTLRAAGDDFAITTQVIAEFIHIVTDAKRFTEPLSMNEAIARIELWWTAPEVHLVGADLVALRTFFDWMSAHRLGRKRILDTMLAATYRAEGVHSLLTTNARDFSVLGGFKCIVP